LSSLNWGGVYIHLGGGCKYIPAATNISSGIRTFSVVLNVIPLVIRFRGGADVIEIKGGVKNLKVGEWRTLHCAKTN